MALPSINNSSINGSLQLDVHFDINDQLHDAFSLRYSEQPKENIIDDISNISIPCLQADQAFEVWQGVQQSKNNDDWKLYHNNQYLIATVPSTHLQNLTIDAATEKAYTLIFQQLESWGYPYLIRTWNFFNGITDDGYGANNNYQLFCSGRTRAYSNYPIANQAYPAATVIGTNNDLHIHFIASKTSGLGIENTKQVSAYEYPAYYSEDPPLFSRAVLHQNDSQNILFISGTASITSHSTQHEGDINRQTEVCLDNIQHLLNTAIHDHQLPNISISDFTQLKVFIKHSEHIKTVRTHIESLLGTHTSVIYLNGDMCRTDLLVEIEAIAITPKP